LVVGGGEFLFGDTESVLGGGQVRSACSAMT
jgi:hypothetical protein